MNRCVSCGDDSDDRLLGVCPSCQDFIIKTRSNDLQSIHDKWCSEESAKYQEIYSKVAQERRDLRDSKKVLKLVKLLREIL